MQITLKASGTTATTGGTDNVFSETSKKLSQGKILVDADVADFFARPEIQVSCRVPFEQTDGTYCKQRNIARFVIPDTLADGSVVYNFAEIHIEYHPESYASLSLLREMAGQLAMNAGLDSFYETGSLE